MYSNYTLQRKSLKKPRICFAVEIHYRTVCAKSILINLISDQSCVSCNLVNGTAFTLSRAVE